MAFERDVEFATRILEQPRRDLDAGPPELRNPRSAVSEVRIGRSHDDAGHSGVDQCPGTRGRPPEVVAGLERAHDGRAAGPRARGVKRNDLRVIGAGAPVPPLAEEVPVGGTHDRTHEGVG